MDWLFLARLVDQTAPELLGRRVRSVGTWAPRGFFLTFSGKPPATLVFSLFTEAPGFYLRAAKDPPRARAFEEKSLGPRFKQLLTGAELVSVEPHRGDRVVEFHWRKGRPSGKSSLFRLVVEWAGARQAAFLVSETNEILDIFSPGAPRLRSGETFVPLTPPPDMGAIPETLHELEARLEDARRLGLSAERTLRAATGLPPILADEVRWLSERKAQSLVDAFFAVKKRLDEGEAAFVVQPAPGSPSASRVSVLSLESKSDFDQVRFDSFNEAARVFVDELDAVFVRKKRAVLAQAIARALKKERERTARMTEDRSCLEDPAELRRRGELLLANVTQALPVLGGVEVTDFYGATPRVVVVPLDPRYDLVSNAQRFFHRSRKNARASAELEAREAAAARRIDHLETLQVALDAAAGQDDLDALADEIQEAALGKRSSRTVAPPSRRPGPFRFRSSRGSWILVGRSARGNDELTFKTADPDDLWFHAAETPGAHVVLRARGATPPADEEIEEAAAAAAHFSKAKGATRVEVVCSVRKNVSKIPGAPPGTVKLSKFRTLRVRPARPAALVDEDDQS